MQNVHFPFITTARWLFGHLSVRQTMAKSLIFSLLSFCVVWRFGVNLQGR
jgi:hypothetical protein